jgi:hypothetical protein
MNAYSSSSFGFSGMKNWIGVPLAEFDKEVPELPLTDS